jgi:hypothetical protein
MIEKVLLAAVGTAALAVPTAIAQPQPVPNEYKFTVPDEFIGAWCKTKWNGNGANSAYAQGDIEKCQAPRQAANWVNVRKDGFSSGGIDCKVVKYIYKRSDGYTLLLSCTDFHEPDFSATSQMRMYNGQMYLTPLEAGDLYPD